MALGIVFAPLWWLWYTVLYIYSHSWALAVSISALSSGYLVYRHRLAANDAQLTRSRPKVVGVVTKHATLVQEVEQVLPVHPHNGWCLSSVSHGVRVFCRFFTSLGVPNTPCLAATTIINVSPRKLLSISTNGRDIPCWLEGVNMAPQYIQQSRGTSSYDADIIQLSFTLRAVSQRGVLERCLDYLRQRGTQFTQKYATFLDGLFGIPAQFVTETFEREWNISGEGCGQVCWVARQPSQLPYHWSMLLFSASVKEKSQSIATLVMLPKSPDLQPLTSDLLTSQLISLKDFSCLRRARIYSHISSFPSYTTPPFTGHVTSLVTDATQHSSRNSGRESPVVMIPEPSTAKPVQQVPTHTTKDSHCQVLAGPPSVLPNSHPVTSHVQEHRASGSDTSTPSLLSPPSPSTSHLSLRYAKLGVESCDRLVLAAQATERDGWIAVGTNKDVVIMKKPPEKGEATVNCVKGTGTIRAPPEFVFRVVRNRENNSKLDDMLKETRLIDSITDTSFLVHLLFKAVWPTAPRDFAIVSTAGRYDDTMLIKSGVSVVDHRLPEEKGYVRGNIVCGGYVIRECAGKPEQSTVTYVSQAELRGNIPSFAVNKVTESQPMCIARLRALAEKLYTELKHDRQRMKEFEEATTVCPIRPTLAPPTLKRPSSSSSGGGGFVTPISDGGESGGEEERVGEKPPGGPVEGDRGEERGVGGEREGGEAASVSLQSRVGGGGEAPNGVCEGVSREVEDCTKSWAVIVTPPTDSVATETKEVEGCGGGGRMLVMEAVRAYTPDEFTSNEEDGEEEEAGDDEGRETTKEEQKVEEEEEEEDGPIRFEKKLQPYPIAPETQTQQLSESLTEETIAYPRQESGGVDYRTLGNQTAARVLEELFHVSSLDIYNPTQFNYNESTGWKVIDIEKEVVILKKKIAGNPFLSFMGKGVIELPPRKVYDSIRNPQLRFTYDNMLKELHFVKHIEDGLYVLHIHHETTQCFIKQSRDFCVLVNERVEGNKLLLVGMSVDIPECPINPNITRGKITYSGWVIEPHKAKGKTHTIVTYLLQVDLGGIPATLVNYVSKRQPLAIAYLRDYLMSTSLQQTL